MKYSLFAANFVILVSHLKMSSIHKLVLVQDGIQVLLSLFNYSCQFICLNVQLGGIAVTVVGSVTLHDQTIFEVLVDDSLYRSSSYVLIGTGVCIIVFAFTGCWGAVKEVKCLLLTVNMINNLKTFPIPL